MTSTNANNTGPTGQSPSAKGHIMLQPVGAHARFIHAVLRRAPCGAGKSAPEHVKRSWLRCLEEYGLEPNSDAEPVVVPRQELLARKERNLELVSLADAE